MTKNFQDIAEFAEAMEIDTALATRGLAFRAFNSLTLKTPVDTGRARANWQVSVGNPATGTIGEPTAGKGKHKKASSPPAEPKAEIPSVDIDGKSPVWITNNLPYIEALENGHSKQAPRGMVALTYAEIQGEIDARIFIEFAKSLGFTD